MYKELKRKLEQDKVEMEECTAKYLKGKRANSELFEIEPMETNTLQCYTCGIDTFYTWVSEKKKFNENFLCVRCAIKNIDHLRETNNDVYFYYKYEDEQLETFFKRIEGRIADSKGYLDIGPQRNLLIKTDWPEVVTKADLEERGVPVIHYDRSPEEM